MRIYSVCNLPKAKLLSKVDRRLKAIHFFERRWYSAKAIAWLLPLNVVYGLIGLLRRRFYRWGLFRVWQAPVPVVVVGNISVGGTGKTPLTIALIEAAQQQGLKVGVVSRGYGREDDEARVVSEKSTAEQVGDEPLLIYLRTGVAVAVASSRRKAAELLLKSQDLDVMIADDGLQHYALGRDAEVVVVDSSRGFGNGWQLPAGPLREPLSRLAMVDALVVNQRGDTPMTNAIEFGPPLRANMQLKALPLVNLADSDKTAELACFSGKKLLAIAGIGNPEAFYSSLRSAGLIIETVDFPDHHSLSLADIPDTAEAVLMTEKDAVKLRAAGADSTRLERCWMLPVSAELRPDLSAGVLQLAQDNFSNRVSKR